MVFYISFCLVSNDENLIIRARYKKGITVSDASWNSHMHR